MKNKFLRFLLVGFLFSLAWIPFSLAQSPVFFSSGDYANPNSWTQASAAGLTTIVGTNIHTTTPNGTGNRYFRFYSATVAGTTYEPNGASDILLTANTSTALQISGVGMAYYLNIANAASNVVFKTIGSGTPGTSRVVAFEIQGAIRTISSVTQSPLAGSVFPAQTVTVTANLSGAFATGQGVYLRYSNDGYATSTVVQMTGGGTVYTADIPSSLNVPGAGISYYVFTSGNTGPAANGSDADLYTINLDNNGGSNYSYTVASGWVTASNGSWGTAATWTANAVPPVATSMGSVVVGHNVTLNQDALMSALTINVGATFTASDASPRTLTISNNVNGTNLTNNGTWANGAGGSTLVFAGSATHTIAGTSAFHNINTTTGINFGAGSTINNNFQINAGGFVATNGPTYGGSSTLIYNSGGTYIAGTEWYANLTSGQGVPKNVLIGNGVNTTVTFGTAAQFRHAMGNVSISVASGLTLSTVAGGDLQMEGDFSQNGTLTHNNRSVGFYGSNAQSISGTGLNTAGASNNIPYLIINNSSVSGVTINSALLNSFTAGNGLQLLNSGPLHIAAGITFTLAGANGNILASGGTRVINFDAASSVMAITAAKTVTSAGGGLLDFTSSVSFGTLRITAAVNFGAGLSTIGNNTYLQINTGGSVLTNAPTYLTGSTLNYNTAAVYGRGTEWSAVSGAGYPYHVLISNSGTTLNLGNGAAAVARAMAGNLTINDGCTLTMNVPVMTASLTVAGDINIGNGVSGTLALSTGAGGSLLVGGNFTKTSGTFACNGRSVNFNGTGNQSFLSNTAESINFLIVSNTTGTVTFNSDINVPTAGNSATFNANSTTVIDAAAVLTMNEGTTFTGNNAGSLITVNGILRNTGTANGATFASLAANLVISSTGTYNHNLTKSGQANLGAIPLATWNAGSTCLISGLTNPNANSWFTSGATQSFSNFTWNTTALTTNPNMLGATLSVNTFSLLATNTGALRMGNAAGGSINCVNYTHSGGTLDMGNTTGSGAINCTGTFNFTGGTITELGSGTAHLIHFNGTSNQTLNFSGTVSNIINFRFNNAAGYTLSGNIPVNANATLSMTQGAFAGAGTITYNAAGTTLVYDGSTSITTTNYEFPAANGPVNVTINNAGGVILHASRTLPATGVFTELAGIFRLGSNDLTLDNIAAAALVNASPSASNMIAADGTGQLKRTLPAAARNLFFYIGDETGTAEYSGIQLNFTANSTVRVIGVRCVDATSGNMNTPTTPFDFLSRSWHVTLSTNAGTYTYTPTLTYNVAGDVNGTESQLQVSAYNGGTWTAYATTVASPSINTTAAVTQATCSLNGTEFSGRTPMKYWVGGTVGFTTDWNTAANWSPAGVPVAADNIVINNGAFACIVPTATSHTVNHVYLNGTGNLQLAGTASLSIAGNFTYVNTASATFACASTFTLSNAINNQTVPAFNYGNLNIAGGPRTLAGAGTIGICGNYTPTAAAITTAGSTVNFNGTAAQAILVNGTTFNNLTISNSSANVSSAFSATVNGTLQVNTNARWVQTANTLTLAGTGSIDGFLRNSGATITASGALTFNAGSTYEHNHTTTAGTIPTATWNVNSTCSIIGYTTGGGGNFFPGGLTQSFGNFNWNCPSQSNNARLDGNLTTINGDFSVGSTGASKLRLVNNTVVVINVGGDVSLTGGYTSLSSGNNANVTLNVAGDYTQSAGTLDLADGNNTPIGYLAVAGDFNFSAGTLGQTSTTPNNGTVAFVEWNGTVAQNVTISGTIQNTTNFRLNNNAGINLTGTVTINQNGNFFRKAGAITGGTISYSATGTSLVYEASSPMTTTSLEWPTVNPPINLVMNSSSVVSLHASRSLGTTGVFTETSGVLSLGAFDLSINNTAAAAIVNAAPSATNMIAADGAGQLFRALDVGGTNLQYYIGDLTGTANYSGIRMNFTANNTARMVGIRCVDATSGNMNTPYAPIDFLSRSWHVTLSTTVGTYTCRPFLTYDVAGDVNGTENNLQVAAFFGGAWTHYGTTVSSPTINTTATVNQGTCPLDGVELSGRTPVKYWVGGVLGLENDWNTANNWLPSGVPIATDNIDINDGTYACDISTALTPTVNHLTLNGTGVLNLLGNAFLTIAGNFTYNPTATATFSCSSTFRLSNGVFNQTVPALSYGNLNISGGARTLINAGTISICGNYTPATVAQTTYTGSHVDFNGTTAQSILTNNTSFNNLTISNTSANVSSVRSITIYGIMQVNAGARFEQTALTLTIAGGASANIDGFLRNSAATVTATGTMTYSATGVYEHNFTTTDGTIPTSTWASGSTCLIMGYTTGGPPLGLGQSFSNFTWNCPAQSGNVNLAGNLTTVNGNLTITSTNASQLILTNVNAAYTLNVGGDFTLSAGTFNLRSNNNNVATTMNVGGNFTQNGGTFTRSGTGATLPNVNFNHASNLQTLTQTAGSITTNINWNINGAANTAELGSNFNLGAGTGTFTVAGGAGMDFKTFFLSGGAAFTAASNATLITANTDATGALMTAGANGSVQTTGARTFTNTGVNYTFNGTAAQFSGNAIAAAANIGTLNLSNTSGANPALTFNASTTVATAVNVNNGINQLGVNNITVTATNAAAVSGGSATAFIQTNSTGELRRAIANIGLPITYDFPVGTSTNYTPASYQFTTNTIARNLHVRAVAATHPQMNIPNPQVDFIANRYWKTDLSNNTGVYNYTSSYTFLAGDINGTLANIALNRYDNGSLSWSEDAGSSAAGLVLSSGALTHLTGALTVTPGTVQADWVGRIINGTYIWNGSVSGVYTTAANWTPPIVGGPSAIDNIVINAPGTNQLNVTGAVTVYHLTLNGTGVLNMAAGSSFTVNGNLTTGGTPTANFDCASTFNIARSNTQTIPAFTYGNLNISGGDRVLANSGTIGICGVYTPTAGVVTNTGSTINFLGAAQNIPSSSYNNLVISGSGTKTVTGNLLLDGNLNISAGTLDVGAFVADRTSPGGVLDLDPGATLRIGGTSTWPANFVTHNVACSSTVDYYGAAQTVADLNTGANYGNLILSGSGFKTLLAGTTNICGDFSISGTATTTGVVNMVINGNLNIGASAGFTTDGFTYNLKSDINNAGTFNATSSTFIFDGPAAQQITGSNTFEYLTLDNGSTLTINNDQVILSSLVLNSGVLDLNNNDLTLGSIGNNGSLTGGGFTNYIMSVGPASRFIRYTTTTSTDYLFPLGDATGYTPISIELYSGSNVNANSTLTAYMVLAPHPNLGTSPNYISRYWSVEPTNYGANAAFTATYVYKNTDITGVEANLRPFKYNSDGWIAATGSGAVFEMGSGSVNPGTNTVTWSGVYTFSDFTASGGGSPLPISLVEFNASRIIDAVQLTWITATELNNDYFTIERSADGYQFEAIHTEKGAGNSNSWLNYSWVDHSPLSGINYYRLKQTDFDGTSTYSTIRTVDFNQASALNNPWVNVYPNPANDGQVYLSFGSIESSEVQVSIYNLAGQLLQQYQGSNQSGETLKINIQDLPVGLYTLTVQNGNQIIQQKLMIGK